MKQAQKKEIGPVVAETRVIYKTDDGEEHDSLEVARMHAAVLKLSRLFQKRRFDISAVKFLSAVVNDRAEIKEILDLYAEGLGADVEET